MNWLYRPLSMREVVITGLGAVTALGPDVEAFFAGLLSGASGIRPVSLFDPARYVAKTAAEVHAIPEDAEGKTNERGHLLALAAAQEALSSFPDFGGRRAAVVAGTTLGGNRVFTDWLLHRAPAACLGTSTLASASRLLARRFGARGPVQTVSVACASGTAAVGLGAELIRRDEADSVLAGGYDALSEFVFSGFDSLRALSPALARPFDARRDGLTLGEGAGFVVLEREESATRRGAHVLAVVRGYASAGDAHHMTRPSPSGDGLVRALEAALASSGLSSEDVGFVNAHGTATAFNDRMEAAAFTRVFGEKVRTVPMNSIKGAIGHTLGGAGALEAVLTALVLSRGVAPPTAGLTEPDPALGLDVLAGAPREIDARVAVSTSSAFAGTSAALVLERA